jgi:hypothetical protein
MPQETTISLDDLSDALMWVSAAAWGINSAYICRSSGRIYWASQEHEVEEELPEDIEDASLYLAVPHKHDLNLGRNLVFDFVEEQLPDAADQVAGIFRRRGAYRRFKDLLDRRGKLEQWYAYEEDATRRALLDWADAEGIEVRG